MSETDKSNHNSRKVVDYTPPSQPPNIILIVMDAFRAPHMASLGYKRPTTPNLDRIAAEGVLFEQAISPGAWSLAGHASLFTGLHVSKHGAHDEHKFLSDLPENITLAQRLKAAGYTTWAHCENHWVGSLTGLDRGFEKFWGYSPVDMQDKLTFYLSKSWARLTDSRDSGSQWATTRGKRFIRQAAEINKPFFIFLQYLEPHAPYNIPRKWRKKFLPSNIPYQQAIKINQDPNSYIAGAVKMTEQDFEIMFDLYDTSIASMDSQIGKLIDFLGTKNLRENNLAIITAHHGEN